MTDNEQKVFFAVLRAAAWQEDIVTAVLRETFSWQVVIDTLDRHRLLAFAADAIMSLPDTMLPAPGQQDHILRCVSATVRSHYRLNRAVSEVFTRLTAEGFHPVLLKGQGLSALYPMQYVRQCGDIDIFIGTHHFWHACDIVDDYCGGTGEERQEKITIHWSAHKDDIDIEVHQVAADTAMPSIKEEYNRWVEQQMAASTGSVTIDNTEIAVPAPLLNSIYVFEHLLKHLRVEGVGIRQFIDWMMVIRHLQQDKGVISKEQQAWLRTVLTRFHLINAWQTLGGILVWQLGMDSSLFPFWDEQKARHSQGRNLQYIIDAGDLGHSTAAAKGYYFMEPSLLRDIKALRYYWRHILFEYHVFPHDTIQRTLHRIWEKI